MLLEFSRHRHHSEKVILQPYLGSEPPRFQENPAKDSLDPVILLLPFHPNDQIAKTIFCRHLQLLHLDPDTRDILPESFLWAKPGGYLRPCHINNYSSFFKLENAIAIAA